MPDLQNLIPEVQFYLLILIRLGLAALIALGALELAKWSDEGERE